MARRSSSRRRLRLIGAMLLLALLVAGWGWWTIHHWRPPVASFPVQGIEVGAEDGPVDWKAAKAIGASFVYLGASASAFARDPAFARNLEDARAAKLQVGAVHQYDPCQPAERQAANFMTVVPRDKAMLPPAVDLDLLADQCPIKVGDAAVQSELMTFLNQIETHTGKPTILKISQRFEKRYHVARKLDRNLWLERLRFEPDYAGRPWTLWTANAFVKTEAGPKPLRWVVLGR
ncbi:MAG: glycoside hydrolase family 25 protein [Novosphingobium sp.]|uniref:glycoside hydrolase family 25 protein n=1 Tax=Novosphingobium sp. TaxID=1874826 RepID=UPI0032BDD530